MFPKNINFKLPHFSSHEKCLHSIKLNCSYMPPWAMKLFPYIYITDLEILKL